MDRIWAFIVDILIGIIVIFATVAIYFGLRTETVMKSLGKNITEDFLSEVKESGCITIADYEEYMGKLFFTDTLYEINLEHDHVVIEPEYRFRTLEEIIAAQNVAYAGSNIYHFRDVTTEYPEVHDPTNNGSLNTETNESILAKAVDTPASPGHIHSDDCYAGHRHTDECASMPLTFSIFHSSYSNNSRGYTSISIYCGYCHKLILDITRYNGNSHDIRINDYINSNTQYFYEISSPEYSEAYDFINLLMQNLEPYVYYFNQSTNSDAYGYTKKGYVPGENFTFELPFIGEINNCIFCDEVPLIFEVSGGYNSYYSHYEYSLTCNYCSKLVVGTTFRSYSHYDAGPFWSVDIYGSNGLISAKYSDKNLLKPFCDLIQSHSHDSNGRLINFSIALDDPTLQFSFLDEVINHGRGHSVLSCQLEEDTTPECNQMVISITPTHLIQTVATLDPIITTVIATYRDGSSKTVECTTNFSTASTVQNQPATLVYTYIIDGITYTKTANVTVTVVPRVRTCINGHTYNLNSDGTDSGCPYCRAWIRNLRLLSPTTSTMTITIGTTLQDNGVTLLATYYDGHTETVTAGYVDNLDTAYLGTKPVTIGYKGKTVQLMITTVCAKMTCDICGYVYNLYPDGTNPGCPRCIQKTPVFTGNILRYEETIYTEELLEVLYNEGKYIFNLDDSLTINLNNKSKSIARNILNKIYPVLSDKWFNLRVSEKIGTK